MNKYIPNEDDKKRQAEMIERTAAVLNIKPHRQGSNQRLEDYIKPEQKKK